MDVHGNSIFYGDLRASQGPIKGRMEKHNMEDAHQGELCSELEVHISTKIQGTQ